ncbi:MAG: polymer-forming cytoskeletal protein [Bacteroidales bacterium]|jgi:cytoskeletal protein CcmA (bactofilin family)|nr:polymer-forming cytoskeletal protein [Bacteroidales bacterium]MBR7167438.1 polymer-forming cytoskeletal protein [Bacteroidales bacterium]
MAKPIEVENNPINTITTGTVIRGDIITPGDFRMDGVLEGNLTINGKLVIGECGKIVGNIVCQNANVIGAVEGNMKVTDLLTLCISSKVKGDLLVNKLSIEPGASFDGSCKMLDETNKNSKEKSN